jgi:streptogramin lyase
VNDAAQPSRAWVDYRGRIWVEQANQGAIYSANGMTIQFDRDEWKGRAGPCSTV